MIQLLEQKQQAATAENDRDLVAMHAKDIFDDGFSWVGGNPDGQFTVVEFLDYQCGFCRRAQPEVTELLSSDGDIRLIVKEMPILGPGSELAARAAVATLITRGAGELRRAARPADGARGRDHRREPRPGADRRRPRPGRDPRGDAGSRGRAPARPRRASSPQKLAISGTPTFVFDNRMVRGYLPLAQMRDLVGEVRAAN